MKLHIDFPIPKHGGLDRFTPVFLLGSCFAEQQVLHFTESGFPCRSNPFGICYNPVSMRRNLEQLNPNFRFATDQLMEADGRWFHPDHHGTMEFSDPDEAIEQLRAIREAAWDDLRQAGVIVLTLGTALVYEHLKSSRIVGNCHRIPSNQFQRQLLERDRVVDELSAIQAMVKEANPSALLVYTISPVRHLRSGVEASALSKAILRTAIHEAGLDPFYFPAYEIFMDELRDYRFCQTDLSHPNDQAQQYIWERFMDTYASSSLLNGMKEVRAYSALKSHRPLRDPKGHAAQVEQKRTQLLTHYPGLTLDRDL